MSDDGEVGNATPVPWLSDVLAAAADLRDESDAFEDDADLGDVITTAIEEEVAELRAHDNAIEEKRAELKDKMTRGDK